MLRGQNKSRCDLGAGKKTTIIKIYFSYEINLRKPDFEIYDFIVRDSNLKAEETVFLDDNLQNVKAAEAAGIKSIHVQPPETILEYLKKA